MNALQTTLETRIERLLRSIVSNASVHGRWLNTLSFLEHVGSRKIFRARLGAEMNEMLLRHAAEEARHALFFKSMARRESGASDFQPESLLCGWSANRYIQSLDGKVREYLGPNRDYHCYLLTTYLIEIRAGSVYPLYQQILTEAGSSISLRSVILEEEGHLREMTEEMAKHSLTRDAENLSAAEESLFRRFLEKLETCTGIAQT